MLEFSCPPALHPALTDFNVLLTFLKLRNKTAGIAVGVMAGGLCLWAIAAWQNLGWADMFGVLIGNVLLLGGIMLAAFLLIAGCKLLSHLLNKHFR